MAVRVLRLMEYVYPDLESAHEDMGHWAVQGTRSFGRNKSIRSAVLVNPIDINEPFPYVSENDAPEEEAPNDRPV